MIKTILKTGFAVALGLAASTSAFAGGWGAPPAPAPPAPSGKLTEAQGWANFAEGIVNTAVGAAQSLPPQPWGGQPWGQPSYQPY